MEISVRTCIYLKLLITAFCPLSQSSPDHRLQRSIFFVAQDSVKFQQPKLMLRLYLLSGQSEPHCSYKVVLIKKAFIYYSNRFPSFLASNDRNKLFPKT